MFGENHAPLGFPLGALALRAEMQGGTMRRVRKWRAGDAAVEIRRGHDSLWLLLTHRGGGFALRTAYSPGSSPAVQVLENGKTGGLLKVTGSLGTYTVRFLLPDPAQSLLRCTVSLVPESDLLTPFWPRDLYPLDAGGNPLTTEGTVHAAQRGVNGGLVFLSLTDPCCGSLLYFQNLTALNPYFLATETKPDGIVGGKWPELGCQLPTVEDPRQPPTKPLIAGQEYVLSDVFLHYRAEVPEDPRHSARLFLDLLAGVYAHLERPETKYHDWPRRAEETLGDLEHSPKATISYYGSRYVRPYTGFEYPDSMVQLTVLTPLREYQDWKGTPLALTDELRKGIHHFYDKDLKTMRRYLPNVSDEKDRDAVDSWYLYHPLTNLARLAKEGDEPARELFFGSLEYAIKVARHFEYKWPVQFNVQTLDVITAVRKEGEPGQSDAGGLYAYVMIQAWELSRDAKYLEEAEKAIQATKDRDFNIAYQTNLTAWGVNACIHLWRITSDPFYQQQSFVFLASFFHNSVLWESEIKAARHYRVFLGETCLHDAPYMAIYECFESYAAFHEYLTNGQEDLPHSVRLLVTEYLKYTLTRAWYYYPRELPEDILATDVRNNEIDRALAFPLEDLYPDGQPPGQVGQEIYGCGAAFALLTRAYHRFENAPFLFYCEYPIADVQSGEERRVTLEVRGLEGMTCRARLIPLDGKLLPAVQLHHQKALGAPNEPLPGETTPEGHCEFVVPASSRLLVAWKE